MVIPEHEGQVAARSLGEVTPPTLLRDVTVIVRAVDGASDDCLTYVAAELPHAQIRTIARSGAAWDNLQNDILAVNRLIAEAETQFVLLLDSDLRIAGAAVKGLIEHLRHTPGCAVAAAQIGSGDRDRWRPRTVTDAVRLVRDAGYGSVAPEPACFVSYRVILTGMGLDPLHAPLFVLGDLEARLGGRAYSWDTVDHCSARRVDELDGVAFDDLRGVVVGMRRFVSPRWSMPSLFLLWLMLLLETLRSALAGRRTVARGIWDGLGLARASSIGLDGRPVRLRRLLGRAKSSVGEAPRRLGRRRRRRRLISHARRRARSSRGSVRLSIAKDVDVARDVQIEVHPGADAALTIEAGVTIQSGSIIRLGGSCFIGARSQLRYGVVLNAKGKLVLTARNILGRGTMVHADGEMTWEWGASCAEFVSVLDSHHEMDGTLPHVHDHPVVQSHTHIGASSLIGAHVTVLPGVALGRGCLVGAGSVLTRSTPDSVIVAGIPARVLGSFDQSPRSASEKA